MGDGLSGLVQSQPLIALGAGLAALLVVLIAAWLLSGWTARSRSEPAGRLPEAPPRTGSAPPERPPEPKSMPPGAPAEIWADETPPESAPAEMPPEPEPQIARSERRPSSVPRPSASRAPIGEERSDHYIVRTYFGTDRADQGAHKDPDDRFNDDRARPATGHPVVSYGHVDVSIPKIHKVGELEAPATWFHSEQPGKHIMLLGLQTANADAFFNTLKDAVDDPKQAFIFVHGFSVSFEDAARRTAQLAFDLKFRGAPIFFSWPTEVFGITNPDMTAYSEAENNSRWATQHFRQFLQDVIQKTGAQTVHLIAHSMGNRVVTDALMELYWILSAAEKDVLGEVILTAPDIDADVFVEQIAPRITEMNSAVTLYASDRDSALATSKRVHGYPRIGDFGAIRLLPLLPTAVEFIDASDVDTDSLGHSYYGNSESVISDICHLIGTRTRANTRSLTLADAAFDHGAAYWSVKRETSLADVVAAIEKRLRAVG
jgi:esterase/lipase superfamily enzyme